jgi:hypothetical protein
MSFPAVSRPGSVTFVVVLVWISAILEIIAGVLLRVVAPLVRNEGASDVSMGVLITLGIVTLLIGLITAAVASRLGKGGNGARVIVTILEVLQIVSSIATIIAVGGSANISSSLVTIVFAVVILALLWNNRANQFFASR